MIRETNNSFKGCPGNVLQQRLWCLNKTLTHILESRVQNLHILYIYIYPLFSFEQTWKIVKLRMRTEMEEPFYTTLFHFIIT